MRRRDLLVGAGGLAAGSSLIVGSNAFTSVEAERDFDVDIVDGDGDPFASADIPEEFTVSTYDIGSSNAGGNGVGVMSNQAATDDEEPFTAIVDSPEPDDDVGRFGTTSTDSGGLIDIDNRLNAAIEADVEIDHEHVECIPDGDSAAGQGDRVSFNAKANCLGLDDDGETVKATARVNGDREDAISASIQREIEIHREVIVAVEFDCTTARVELATSPGQPGEHLQVEPPIDVTTTFVDGPEEHTVETTIDRIDDLPWSLEPHYDKIEYDKIESLELDGGENEYTFENSLTRHSQDGGHSHWECNKNWTSDSL